MNISTSYLTIYGSTNPSIVLRDGDSRLQLGVASSNNCYAIGGLKGDGVIRSLGTTNNVVLAIANNDKDGKSYVGISDNGNGIWARFTNDKTFRVDGTIKATLINVVTNVWADDVFEKDYIAPSINEIEQYIKENGHLQGVPSTEQVSTNGINVAEMSAILLRKIEELTLIV